MTTLTIQARFCTVNGKGVGRWRNYYRADDLREARWAARHLVPSAQVRVMEGRSVVVAPRRVSEFLDGD